MAKPVIDEQPIIDEQPMAEQPQQPSNIPISTYAKVGALGLQPIAEDVGKDIAGNIEGLGSTLKAGLYDVPKAMGALPGELARGLVTGDMPSPEETQLGQFTKAGTKGMAEGIKEVASDPLKTIATHPVSTAALFTGLGGEAGPESAAKGFSEEIASKADSSLASLNKKLAVIPTKATQMEGYKQPVPTQADLATGTQNVIKAFQDVMNEHGKILDEAKREVGLPATKEEKDLSIRKYGNVRNLDIGKPLDLPEARIGETRTVEGPSVLQQQFGGRTHLRDQLEQWAVSYRDNPELAEESINKIVDLNTNREGTKGGWFPNQEIADKFKSELISKLKEGKGAPTFIMSDVAPEKPMPYTITPTKTAEDLNTEIGRFLKNQDYISDKSKIKAASYYQDKINGFVDWTKEQGDIEGLLKSKHGDLKQIIADASPRLQDAKTQWANLNKNLDLVKDHIDPEQPGKTQSYLKRLFTSDSPEAQDKLKQLAYLEKMTKQPVITQLFKKFAGESFASWASRPGRELMEAAGGATAALFGHPAGAIGAGALLAAQSPRVLGAIESGVSKIPGAISKFGPQAAYQAARGGFTPGQSNPANQSTLQSVRDRLQNAQ